MADYLRESGVKWLWERIKTLLSAKQDKLVSGSNIKTINGTSVLGAGNITIEGGGDFDSSGSYPNLTAGKANKLATPRKIGITGGAVGTATNFDGSGNINIPVTKIDEGILAWSKNYAPFGTLFDNVMKIGGNNVLAFMPPSAITIEYSTDNGVTWLDYGVTDANKIKFVTPELGTYMLLLGKDSNSASASNRLRLTLDFVAAGMRFTPSKIAIKYSALSSSRDNVHTKLSIEKYVNYNQDVWEEITDKEVLQPDWGTYILPTADWGYESSTYRARLRCEVYRTTDSVNKTYLTNIIIMATKIVHASNYAQNRHLYTFDYLQNATFPAAITANKLATKNGTANQVVLGNGSLKPISELSPITDADADILLDNHIHSIDVNANGNDVNINVIESSKNGNTWETEDNDISIPLATTTSAGVMSKEDKAKLDDLSVIEVKYTLTEDEYNNHEIVNLYNIVYAISNRLYNNGWLYNDDKSYDVVVKGWVDNRYNAITYANFNVRLLTTQDGHSLGINGYVDVAQITETNENADCPLWVGYICGKYHIEDDGMAFYAPENPNFIVEA